ncbi:MAG: RecX family transcriptional regulator [Alphaproteobacteria bacterium]|nr:RecX family transcriptional regulator [Alphaproteobacteria bacterium]
MQQDDDGFPSAPSVSSGNRGLPRKVDPAFLERAALRYLERFSSSVENLRRLLRAKVDRSVAAHGTCRAEAFGWVEAVLAKMEGLGYLDDGRYAATRARGLNRKGRSAATIRMDLRARGVDTAAAAAAVKALGEEHDDPEWAAAVALARRRRLGPFRPSGQRGPRCAKDLMALARAGFSYELARRIVDAETPEALEQPRPPPGKCDGE